MQLKGCKMTGDGKNDSSSFAIDLSGPDLSNSETKIRCRRLGPHALYNKPPIKHLIRTWVGIF